MGKKTKWKKKTEVIGGKGWNTPKVKKKDKIVKV